MEKLSSNVPRIVNAGITIQEPKSNAKSPMASFSDSKSSSTDKVRVLDKSEYKEAAATLADAFAEDGVVLYPINCADNEHWTAEQKKTLVRQMMEYVTYAHMLKGRVTAIGPNYDCVALW